MNVSFTAESSKPIFTAALESAATLYSREAQEGLGQAGRPGESDQNTNLEG